MSPSAERRCGDCQLCCKLLPVQGLGKAAGQRCAVYARLGAVSPACKLWSCRWLVNNDTDGLSRPDRSHYVIDLMPDYVTLVNDDGRRAPIEVVQIWIDPSYPDAHRDPALRAYLERRAAQGIAAIVRSDNVRAMVIFAPALSADRQWHEVESVFGEHPHSIEQVMEALTSPIASRDPLRPC